MNMEIATIAYVVAMAFIVVIYYFRSKEKPLEVEKSKRQLKRNHEEDSFTLANRLNLPTLIRYLTYTALSVSFLYFFFYAFIYDYLLWHKNIYQLIEGQPYNIFYLFISTLALLIAHMSFARHVPPQTPLPTKIQTVKSLTTLPQQKPTTKGEKLPPMVSVAEKMLEKDKREAK